MTPAEVKTIIRQELPQILAEDLFVRDFVLRTVSDYYAKKQETESKFDRILGRLEKNEEIQARKWDENNQRFNDMLARLDKNEEEQARKWDENSQRFNDMLARLDKNEEEQGRKWDENSQRFNDILQRLEKNEEEQARKWDEQQEYNKTVLEEIKKLNRKHDSTIGALGSRWGLNSEASFRNALSGILTESFGVEVLNINDYDSEGIVFGQPDQVEFDVIIKNGLVIVCEIKSSIDKAGMYIFDQA